MSLNYITKAAGGLLLSGSLVATSACTTTQSTGVSAYCQENPAVCIAVGVVIAAGIIATAGSGSTAATAAMTGTVGNASDRRLKADIQLVETLDNGLRLYAFRYKGDDTYFVGVMADEVLADPRYAHAVSLGADGYYRVDYGRLPVVTTGMDRMQAASAAVLRRASRG